MINPFKDVNWNPGVAEKRKFAFSLIYALPVIAIILSLFNRLVHHQWKPGLIWLAAGGIVLGCILWLLPQLARPFYLVCYFFGCCMGFVIGNVVFSLFFFLVFTPLGLVLRLANPKAFPIRPDKTRVTYWEDAKKIADLKQYNRQF
jgi:hypothetical protein